jgi:hypothetical protein
MHETPLMSLEEPSGPAVRKILENATDPAVFVTDPRQQVVPGDRMVARMTTTCA